MKKKNHFKYISCKHVKQLIKPVHIFHVLKMTIYFHRHETQTVGPWSYGSWIYNYVCNQCLSPLMLWVRISIRARCTTLYDKVCQWLATGRWFSPGPLVSSTNKTDCHDITEIMLKVALNTIKQTNIKHKSRASECSLIADHYWKLP